MFSSPIRHEPHPQEERKPEQRRPAPLQRRTRNDAVSDDVKRRSLSALKELLRKQKEGQAQEGALPFSQFFAASAAASAESFKIDPSAQVMQLFEKLLDKLIHIDKNGIKETTLVLNGKSFASSIFSGAKITISEYSTAPKIFNIQFTASPEALAYFEGHAASLLLALNKGKFGFSVNRLETEIEKRDGPPEMIDPIDEKEDA